MKRLTLSLLAVAMVAGLSATGVRAAEAAASERPAKSQAAGDRVRQRLDTLAKELNLTEDQKTKLAPILKDQAEKGRAIRADQNLSTEEKRAKNKELREATDKKAKEILTADQYEKWTKQRAAQRNRGGQGAPPAPKTDK